MKGTEKIIAHIQADAKAETDAILGRAEKECDELRRSYEAKAAEAYAERVRAGVRDCQDKMDSVGRIGQMESRKAMLALKQEMVSKSFDRALEMLVELPAEEKIAFYAKLASDAAVTKDEELILNAADAEAIGEAVVAAANAKLGDGKLRLSEEHGSFAGGLLLRRGAIEVNCTAELLVELRRGEMSAQLAGLLFA